MQVSDSEGREMEKEVSGGPGKSFLEWYCPETACNGWVLQVTAVPFSGACCSGLLRGLLLGVCCRQLPPGRYFALSPLFFGSLPQTHTLSAGTHHPSWQFSCVGFSMAPGQLSLLLGPHLVHEKLLM